MPYAPGVQDRSGEFILAGAQMFAQGIQQGALALSEGLSRRSKERKTYLGLADSLAEQGLMSQEQREALNNTSTDEVVGRVKGLMLASELDAAKQRRQIDQAQMETLKYTLQKQKTEDVAQQRFNEMIQGRLAQRGAATVAAGALADPNTLMLSHIPRPAPALGPVNVPPEPLGSMEVMGMAAGAGLPMTSMVALAKATEAMERYGTPGTITPYPGRKDYGFAWQSPTGGTPIRTTPEVAVTPSVSATDVAGVAKTVNEKGEVKYIRTPTTPAAKPDVELEQNIRRLQNERETLVAEKAGHLEQIKQGDMYAGLRNRQTRVASINSKLKEIDAELAEKQKRAGTTGKAIPGVPVGRDPVAGSGDDPLGLFK